jgi:calcineurin-like phosphoesterase family protein
MSTLDISNFKRTWISSDTHFGHANIIKYCNRPYSSAEEMDEDLIERHNKVVGPNDLYIHLGDVAFTGSDRISSIMNRLNGKKLLILGNHDHRKNLEFYFTEGVGEYLIITRGKKERYVLMHYPIESWDRKHHGVPHLHGHCHGTMDNSGLLRFDMGVDCWGMNPVNLEELNTLIKDKREVLLDQEYKERDLLFKQLYDRASKDELNSKTLDN